METSESTLFSRLVDVYNNNSKIIICSVMFIFLCMLIYIPHYNEHGTYSFFGKFYTRNEALQTSRVAVLTQDNKHLDDKYNMIKNNYQSILQKHNTEVDKLNTHNDLLQSKLNQQQDFISKGKSKQKSKSNSKTKDKTQFSEVSKNIINTDRPSLGNMISNNIKKITRK